MEPIGMNSAWHKNIANRVATPKLWMDAFLAAWAEAAGLAFVTFDAGLKIYQLPKLELLAPE